MKESQGRTVYLKDYQVPDFLIDETRLRVELFEDHALVSSRLSMRRNPQARGKGPLVLQGRELELLELAIDGRTLAAGQYATDEDGLTVPQVPERFTLSCRTRIHPEANTSLEGLYKSSSMFCTQCEAEGFRKLTYYLDRPDVLSVFTTTIEADGERYPVLLSNGNNVDRGISADDMSRHWVTWHDPFPKPSYLFALVAGELSVVSDTFTTCSGRDIQLQIYVEEKDLDKCGFAMESLKKAMKWDEEVYGREYDLDIFMIVAVDDFNMGAMENKGLNIFNSSCVLANPATSTDAAFQRIEAIVAHEYFHNWSGNRVTCRDWFQLSLKEGFTVYRDAEFSADMGSRTVKRVEDVKFLRTVQFAEDGGPMAHSVRPESYMEISNFYTVTIYEKGAEVVRMIAQLLGPAGFRKGTDLYFERFDGQAVTTEDFVRTMEEASGLDLSQFRRWYTQAGTPELAVTTRWDEGRGTFAIDVVQSCPPTPGQERKEPFHIPLKVGLLDTQGRELPLRLDGGERMEEGGMVLALTEREQSFEFVDVAERPVPSLLRGFSAPVKLHADYSRDDLQFLLRHDSDGFVRWEAGQQLALRVADELLAAYRGGQELVVDDRLIDGFRAVLEAGLSDPTLDKAMVAHLIQLPSEAYMAEQAEEIDVDGIHYVRETMRLAIAGRLEDSLARVYETLADGRPYVFDAPSVAARSLKNTALGYLMLLDDSEWLARCHEQYEQSDNMTDVAAALHALVNADDEYAGQLKRKVLAEFHEEWKHEPLVVDQWLAVQAGANVPDNLPHVRELMRHEAFNIKNPNKVRAVIGAFCNGNPAGFHHVSGEGYQFLADQVLTLNALNPQIAARLLTPLTRWRRHGSERRKLMRQQLQRILGADKLSRDVYEVVSKSLKDQ